MALNQSYLSKKVDGVKQYNTDMVMVISETAMNSQLRLYLTHCSWEKTVYFLKAIDDNGNVVLHMLEEGADESKIPELFELGETAEELKKKGSSIYQELDKLNLFSLESGTKSNKNQAVKQAMSYSLGFGIRLEDGLPDEIIEYLVKNRDTINPDDILKIITVNPENSSVRFRQFFKNMEIIQLNPQISRGQVVGVLSVIRQKCQEDHPVDGLWSTVCSVQVDLKGASYQDLADDVVKERIQALSIVPDPDTVFDISQLLLDLSTLQTVSSVSIEGIAPEVRGAVSTLIAEYFSRLEKAGQTVFGHIVLPKPNLKINYLFTPKTRNFAVTNNGFYYLINFEDKKAPLVPDMGNHKDFEWQPLLDGSVTADGAMAINATKFIPLLREKFEPVLQNLAMKTYPYIEAGVYKFDVKWEMGMDTSPQKLNINVDKPWEATWVYSFQHNQDWECVWAPPLPFPVASGKIDSHYEATCLTEFGRLTADGIVYPSYDFLIRIKQWLNFGYNSGGNSGWIFDQTLRFQVGVKVDADGNFRLLSNAVTTDNMPEGITISDWGKFCSFGTLDSVVKSLSGRLNSKIEELSGMSARSFVSGYDTFAGWFLPGCRTFTYKNEGISKYGDFFTYVNYVQE